ncbi:MAG: serine hydrolase, partial [Rhodanobacteraceae bacterium]
MSRTPHALTVLLATLALAVSSPADARKATQKSKRSAARAPHAAVVVKPVADARAISNNAADVARQFDHWLDGIESSGDVAGLAVAIVKDDSVLLERGIGYADWSTREPVTANTAF